VESICKACYAVMEGGGVSEQMEVCVVVGKEQCTVGEVNERALLCLLVFYRLITVVCVCPCVSIWIPPETPIMFSRPF